MAKKTATAATSGVGHNYDAGKRAEIIRETFDRLAQRAIKRAKVVAKFKEEDDEDKGRLKSLGFKMADVAPARRIHELKVQAENADGPDERKKAEGRIAISVATFTECYAAIQQTAHLDFNQILEDGEKARASAADSENKAPFQEDAPRQPAAH